MYSLITLRWNHGGRNVSSATIHRGGKTTKSTFAVPGVSDGDVSTVKIDGSGWSKLTVLIALKRARSYLYGVLLPCHATTSSGEWPIAAVHKRPPNFAISSKRPSRSSKAAVGARKSRALARPLEPMGPNSGRRNAAPKFSQT